MEFELLDTEESSAPGCVTSLALSFELIPIFAQTPTSRINSHQSPPPVTVEAHPDCHVTGSYLANSLFQARKGVLRANVPFLDG